MLPFCWETVYVLQITVGHPHALSLTYSLCRYETRYVALSLSLSLSLSQTHTHTHPHTHTQTFPNVGLGSVISPVFNSKPPLMDNKQRLTNSLTHTHTHTLNIYSDTHSETTLRQVKNTPRTLQFMVYVCVCPCVCVCVCV